MIEQLILVSEEKDILKKYNVKNFYSFNRIAVPSVIGTGDLIYTISYSNPQYIHPMRFGLVKKDRSQLTDEYSTIFIDEPSPAFSYYHHMSHHHPRRCIAILDAFIVATDGRKYLIHFANRERAIALAGFYDTWTDATGQPQVGFALVTTAGNSFFQKLGIKEMPVVIRRSDISAWIQNEYVGSDIRSILSNRNENWFDGYPVKNDMPRGIISNKLLQPIGPRLVVKKASPE